MTHTLKVGSLFSGAGLCDLGFHIAGFEHSFFCEIDPFCQQILKRHWPDVPVFGDIKELSGKVLPAIDVLVGGFPCQDVSVGGKRRGITLTTRSGLWHECKRIINETKPKYVVIENVKGLLSKGLEDVLQDLSAIGYDAEWVTLAASALGAPHQRERVFIVAYPHSDGVNKGIELLPACRRNILQNVEFGSVTNWLGVQVDWSSAQTIRDSYNRCVIRRVVDGRADGVDKPRGAKPALSKPRGVYPVPDSVLAITREQHKEWLPRLKALGNGIVPQQAYMIASCILEAEGLKAKPFKM